MITLTMFLCLVATGECKNVPEEVSYPSIEECEKASETRVVAVQDELSKHGIEVRGITCRVEPEDE